MGLLYASLWWFKTCCYTHHQTVSEIILILYDVDENRIKLFTDVKPTGMFRQLRTFRLGIVFSAKLFHFFQTVHNNANWIFRVAKMYLLHIMRKNSNKKNEKQSRRRSYVLYNCAVTRCVAITNIML